MSRRSLLSSMQRAQFTDFWAHMDERELVRHYTLTESDLDIIQRRRRVQNTGTATIREKMAKFLINN